MNQNHQHEQPISRPSSQDIWVQDNAKVRSFHDKRVNWKGMGIFIMTVIETGSDGKKKPGFVRVMCEPWDLESSMTMTLGNEPKKPE